MSDEAPNDDALNARHADSSSVVSQRWPGVVIDTV